MPNWPAYAYATYCVHRRKYLGHFERKRAMKEYRDTVTNEIIRKGEEYLVIRLTSTYYPYTERYTFRFKTTTDREKRILFKEDPKRAIELYAYKEDHTPLGFFIRTCIE